MAPRDRIRMLAHHGVFVTVFIHYSLLVVKRTHQNKDIK